MVRRCKGLRIAGIALLMTHAHMVRFGEESAEEMVEWVIDHFGVSTSESATSPTILDVGCGNAHLLLLLAEAVRAASPCLLPATLLRVFPPRPLCLRAILHRF